MHHMYYNHGILGWLISAMHLIFPILIIIIIFNLFNSGRKAPSFESQRRGSMDILKERYAAGEITREEFQRMKHEVNN